MDTTPQEIVRHAYSLLGEYGIGRGQYAADGHGNNVPVDHPSVERFCSVGALLRSAIDLGVPTWLGEGVYVDAMSLLSERMGRHITQTNDMSTDAEIKRAFRLAGDIAEATPSHVEERQLAVV